MKPNLRLLDAAALVAYASAVLVAVAHHEPWADEAQSWVIARDLSFGRMLFHEMHYEVSPGLWQSILWIAQHVFHAPYPAMNWIAAAFAIAGAALLIFCAPFPRIVRYLMASSFYISYQYAVIARPYVMLLLFAAAAAIFYRRRRLLLMSASLALLTLVSVHGAVLAGAIFASAAWREATQWRSLAPQQCRTCLLALAIFVVAIVLLFAIALPARDVVAVNPFRGGSLHKLVTVLENALVNPWYLAVPLLLVIAAFAVWRRQTIVFGLGVVGLIVFQAFFYGGPHHEGTIVIALIVALWIAWPDPSERMPDWFKPSIFAAVLCGIFAVQTVWAVRAWRTDYALPYSGAADMAAYLHQIGAQPAEISGFTYFAVALQPYFDHNIYANWPTAYVHHAQGSEPPLNQLTEANYTRYLVVPVLKGDLIPPLDQQLIRYGYVRAHISPGRVLFNRGIWSSETFVLYQKAQ